MPIRVRGELPPPPSPYKIKILSFSPESHLEQKQRGGTFDFKKCILSFILHKKSQYS